MSLLKIIEAYYLMEQNASQYNAVNKDYIKEMASHGMHGMRNRKHEIQ